MTNDKLIIEKIIFIRKVSCNKKVESKHVASLNPNLLCKLVFLSFFSPRVNFFFFITLCLKLKSDEFFLHPHTIYEMTIMPFKSAKTKLVSTLSLLFSSHWQKKWELDGTPSIHIAKKLTTGWVCHPVVISTSVHKFNIRLFPFFKIFD